MERKENLANNIENPCNNLVKLQTNDLNSKYSRK